MSSLFKPAPPHSPLLGPAHCMCVGCCRIIAAKRCEAVGELGRCGDYKGHRGHHTALVCTSFLLAEERIATAENDSYPTDNGGQPS